MAKHWARLAAVVALGAACATPVRACSCAHTQNAGFIHAGIKRLPSNARGAIFLLPEGALEYVGQLAPDIDLYAGTESRLSPASFSISVDGAPRKLAVELSWPDLRRTPAAARTGRAFRFVERYQATGFSRLVPADLGRLVAQGVLVELAAGRSMAGRSMAGRLVRVGPAGGFKAGSRYTITYTGKTSRRWTYPTAVEHVIDALPLDTAAGKYAVALDGPPLARMLPFDEGGMCGITRASLVQRFHYVAPVSHAAYQDAIVFFSESRMDAESDGRERAFSSIPYSPSMCAPEHFGKTARGDGRDMVFASCQSRARVSVRGWAGLLEVDDRLHQAAPTPVDFGTAAPSACTASGILKEAFASGDAQRIEDAVCGFGDEELERGGGLRLKNDRVSPKAASVAVHYPSMRAVIALAAKPDARFQDCASGALARIFTENPGLSSDDLLRYGDSFKARLASPDRQIVSRASHDLARLVSGRHTALPPAELRERTDRLLAQVLDAMLGALMREPVQTYQLVDLVARVPKQAKTQVPALMAAARSDTPAAASAIKLLEAIIPNEATFHELLLGLRQGARRDEAALVYARVAGKAHPQKAVAFLTEAARENSFGAVAALAEFGPLARTSIPVLVRVLDSAPEQHTRSNAFDTLVQISNGEPEVLAALARAMLAPPDRAIVAYRFANLSRLGRHAQRLLPALEKMMGQPMEPEMKGHLRDAITHMQLAPERASALLARLDKVPAPNKKG